MVLIRCANLQSSSIEGGGNWKNCHVKEVTDARLGIVDHDQLDGRVYPEVNNTVLKDNIDIFGGHIRIGIGDFIFGAQVDRLHPVRHLVFLRDPMARFVSGILFQLQKKSHGVDKESDGEDADEQVLEDAVRLIKKRVRGSRKKNHYWTRSLQYLLTSRQVETFATPISNRTLPMLTPEERVAEAQTRLAIQNLASYNCIIGLAEKMGQSMVSVRTDPDSQVGMHPTFSQTLDVTHVFDPLVLLRLSSGMLSSLVGFMTNRGRGTPLNSLMTIPRRREKMTMSRVEV